MSDELYEQVIAIDPQRLQVVKIFNLAGQTVVTGTKEARIRITSNGGVPPYVRDNGRELEINLAPRAMFNFAVEANDFDMPAPPAPPSPPSPPSPPTPPTPPAPPSPGFGRYAPPPFDYDAPRPWDYDAGDEIREEYHRARQEYREQRQEYREERRRYKEEGRRAKENLKQQYKFWKDPGFISGLASGFGQIISSIAGQGADLRVEVPEWLEVEVRSAAGNLEVRDLTHYCKVESASGQIVLSNLRGGANVKSMSGRMEGRGLQGRLTVRGVSGVIELLDCRLSSLDLSGTSNDITVETPVLSEYNEGEYRINNTSGRVRFDMPADPRSSASIECRTLSGRIVFDQRLGYPDYRNRPGQSQARLELNGGRRKVSINTVSGSIEIGQTMGVSRESAPPPESKSWPVPVSEESSETSGAGEVSNPVEDQAVATGSENQWPEANPETPPGREERQMAILQAVERGEIPVEEALKRLAEL